MLIDSHCHLADATFASDLDAIVGRAVDAGVTSALCILAADNEEELPRRDVVSAAWPAVRFAAGVHPHRAGAWQQRLEGLRDVVDAAVRLPRVIAVGEIGLDYHYDTAPRTIQRDVFAAQVDLARQLDRPIVIHAREAMDDTERIVLDHPGTRGVMHCFTGSVDDARRAIDLGLYISLSGIVTFPKSAELREVAAFVPADRLLVETDAPFLAPVPHRGRRNEPAWVEETFRFVARVRAVAADDLRRQLAANTTALLPELDATDAR